MNVGLASVISVMLLDIRFSNGSESQNNELLNPTNHKHFERLQPLIDLYSDVCSDKQEK